LAQLQAIALTLALLSSGDGVVSNEARSIEALGED
jgi:hypothetical protein